MQEDTRRHLSDRNLWSRGLYMLFFLIAYTVVETLLWLLVLFQFIHTLVTGRINDQIQAFSVNLSRYVYDILLYVSFNRESLPYPFSDWPADEPGASPWAAQPASTGPTNDSTRVEAVVEISDEKATEGEDTDRRQ